jgi:hypothetical protein
MAVVYAVRRKAEPEVSWDDIPTPAEQYAATFTTRAAAEEHARQLDAEVKRTLPLAGHNPFYVYALDQLTSFPPYVFRDWLRDADIDPPRPCAKSEQESWVWAEWWNAVVDADALTDAQRQRVWEGLNLYRFFEVVEIDAGERVDRPGLNVVYAVVHQHWEYDDCHYCGANDALAVFRTKGRAEAELRRLSEERQGSDDARHWNGGPDRFVVVELLIEG